MAVDHVADNSKIVAVATATSTCKRSIRLPFPPAPGETHEISSPPVSRASSGSVESVAELTVTPTTPSVPVLGPDSSPVPHVEAESSLAQESLQLPVAAAAAESLPVPTASTLRKTNSRRSPLPAVRKCDVSSDVSRAAAELMMMSSYFRLRHSMPSPPTSPSALGGQDDVFGCSTSISLPPVSRTSTNSIKRLAEPTVTPMAPPPVPVLGPESLPVPNHESKRVLVQNSLPHAAPESLKVPGTSSVPAFIPSQTRNSASASHVCGQCNKVFPSYQALGGHMTAHRKPSLNSAFVGSGQTARAGAAGPAANSGRIHQCKICHRTFPTGQALGGHMRLHYEGSIGAGKSSPAGAPGTSATTKTVTQRSSPRPTTLEFDLNVAHVPMDVDNSWQPFYDISATSAYDELPTAAPASNKRPRLEIGGSPVQPTFYQFI